MLHAERGETALSKIITIWGNPGSGKSVFCAVLARELTQSKEKALIISADTATPMYPVWLPGKQVEVRYSIGHIFSAMEVNRSLIASKMQVYEPWPFLGLLGYAAGENPLAHPEPSAETTERLLHEAAKLVDYVIVDAGSQIASFFAPTAMECADILVRIITPDLRGVSFLKAQTPLLQDGRFHLKDNLNFAGLARPFHAMDEMERVVQTLDGILPYSKEVERCVAAGEMFDAGKHVHSQYMAAVDRVLKEAADDRA